MGQTSQHGLGGKEALNDAMRHKAAAVVGDEAARFADAQADGFLADNPRA